MNFLRVILLSLAIAVISSFGGTVRQLPALPDGATAQALQVDANGNIYVAGSLPPKSPKSTANTTDAFVAKISPEGSKVLYFTVLAGSGADAAYALAVGSDGSAYVTGVTTSTDFPVTPGALQTTYGLQNTQSYDQQAFAVKLDASGATKYATYIGGMAPSNGFGIAIDGAGDAFVLGSGEPTGVPPIPGGDSVALGGFVVKLDPAGSKIVLGFTGLGGDYIAIDDQGAVYLAGLPPFGFIPPYTPDAFQTSEPDKLCQGDMSGVVCVYEYVAKVDPTGSKLIYLTGLNGSYGARPAGIAADASGNAIVAGTTDSPDFPVTPDGFESLYAPFIPPSLPFAPPGPFNLPPPATGFVAKLNATGSGLIWSTFFGGSTNDGIGSMSVDSEGGIYLVGQAGSSDLPGLSNTPAGCRPSLIQTLSFAVRLPADGTSISPAQLFYGMGIDAYAFGSGNLSGPIAIASPAIGTVVALENTGFISIANLLAPSRLACLTDPADNVQLLSVAPGQDLTLFGTMLAASTGVPPIGPVTSLNGVSVTFDGVAASILYTSDDQVNVQVPVQITGHATVQMEVTNTTTAVQLDETRALAVAPQQPSVFLTADALAGAEPSCNGADGPYPLAVAINEDGSRNSVDNPGSAGSIMTIFLNGVAPGAALSGFANDQPASLISASDSNQGALPVRFQIPPTATDGVSVAHLQANGVTARETVVTVCVTATPSGQSPGESVRSASRP